MFRFVTEVLEVWKNEVERYVPVFLQVVQQYASSTDLKPASHFHPSSLSLGIFHDKYKARSSQDLSDYDVVLTTYGTLMADWNSKGRRVLQGVAWFRIILDEGTTTQIIPDTKFHKSMG